MDNQISPERRLSYYIAKSQSINNNDNSKLFDKKIRVAILGSFTLNGLEETLRVKCAEKKVGCITYVSGYYQYNQDILNTESELYKFSPDICFLILDIRSMLKNLLYSPYSISVSERRDFVDKRIEEINNLIRTFKTKSNSKLIISNFNIPVYSPYGICEIKTEYGIQEMTRDLNSKLASLSITDPSVFVYDLNTFVSRYGEINVFDYRQFIFGDIKIAL